jgi:hypothetical protein
VREWTASLSSADKPLLDVVLRPLLEDGRVGASVALAVAAAGAGVPIMPAAVVSLRDACDAAGQPHLRTALDAALGQTPSSSINNVSAASHHGGTDGKAAPASAFRFKSKWVLRALRHTAPRRTPAAAAAAAAVATVSAA